MLAYAVTIIIVLFLVWLVNWATAYWNTPDPLAKIVNFGIIVVAVVIVIYCLLGMLGMAPAGFVIPKV